MKIPHTFYETLKDKISLSETVRKHVVLKKSAGDYKGLCPFHQEKSPSFIVSDRKRFYHCFGCGAHGDVIKFVSSINGLSIKDSCVKLAGDNGIELPKLSKKDAELYSQYDEISSTLETILEFFKASLNQNAVAYLQKRGINKAMIEEFEIGFAPSDQSLQYFCNSHSISREQLIKAGLLSKKDDENPYEVFRNRIIFPIRNIYNKMLGFGGRSLGDGMPKYLNSPETIVFKKNEVLYAENKAISAAYKKNYTILVEGYLDVIALHQVGFKESVASLGTAVTEKHINKLWKISDEIIFCLDGDHAGIRAANKAIEIALPLVNHQKCISFIKIPNGLDPHDAITQNGAAFFQELLISRMSLSEKLWQLEYEGKTFNTAETKANLETTLNNYCNQIQDKILRQSYQRFFKDQVWNHVLRKNHTQDNTKKVNSKLPHYSQSEMIEHAICAMLVHHPHILYKEEVRNFLSSIEFQIPILSDFRDWFLENMDNIADEGSHLNTNSVNFLTKLGKTLEKTKFYDSFLLLSNLDSLFLDTSILKTDNKTSLILWEILCKKYYIERLKNECTTMLKDSVNQDFAKVAWYQKEILKISQELQELNESLIIT